MEKEKQKQELVAAVDIFENANGYVVLADLPGVAEGQVNVRFDKGDLSIDAAREGAEQVYRRAFRLPQEVDASGITAALKDGVLRLDVPKAPSVRPRQIAVTVG